MHDDALAERLALALLGEIVIVLALGLVAVDRAGHFRQRLRQHDQRLLRRPLHGAPVGRRQPRRMRDEAGDGIGKGHAAVLISLPHGEEALPQRRLEP